MRFDLIVADVDGCLTSEGSVPFHEETLHALAAAVRGGGLPPLTLCTGRPQPYVEVLMKLFDIRLPAICENGAVIYTLPDNRAVYGPGVRAERIHQLRALRSFIEDDLLPRHPGTVLQFGKEAQISVFSDDPARLPPLVAPIEEFIAGNGGLPEVHISPSHYYLNISLIGVSKGVALQHLFQELRIDSARVLGIGDTIGDLPIREAVGTFACPANAHGEIREVADYVAKQEEGAGVLEILRHYCG